MNKNVRYWAVLSAMTVLVLLPGTEGDGSVGGAHECPRVFFESIGDLPGDDYASALSDISADGVRAVGESWADDPNVVGDGSVGYPHGYEAAAWTRPCEGRPFFTSPRSFVTTVPPGSTPIGLIGLGYLLPSAHPESNLYGISPDGKVSVGFVSVGDDPHPEAATFRGGAILRMGMLPGDVASAARDVSDRYPARVDRRMWVITWVGSWMDRPRPVPRITVGWSSAVNDHPHRSSGSHAAYWDAFQGVHALPMPKALPNGAGVVSSEAVSVSLDGRIIVGNLYYNDGSSYFNESYPAVWSYKDTGYELVAVLRDLPNGVQDLRVMRVSGDGQLAVGYAVTEQGPVACRWKTSGGAAATLPSLPDASYSVAFGTDHKGTVIVGYCGRPTDDAPWFEERATIWTSAGAADVAQLLQAALPPVTVPAKWQLECRAVSDDGKRIAGWAYRPHPLFPSDPEAYTEEGWVARIP